MALRETQREEVQLHFLHRVVSLETSYISLDDRLAVAKDSDARGLEDCVGSHEVARRAKRFPNYVAPPFRTKRAVLYHNPPPLRKGVIAKIQGRKNFPQIVLISPFTYRRHEIYLSILNNPHRHVQSASTRNTDR